MQKASLKRVALSALKSFTSAAIVILAAADIGNIHNLSEAKALIVAACVAGGNAAFKAVQIALEG